MPQLYIENYKTGARIKVFWSILLTLVVCAAVFGGGDYYLNSQSQNQQNKLNQQVSSLQSEVNQLTKEKASDQQALNSLAGKIDTAQNTVQSSAGQTTTLTSSYANTKYRYSFVYDATKSGVYNCPDNTAGPYQPASFDTDVVCVTPLSGVINDSYDTISVRARSTTEQLNAATVLNYLSLESQKGGWASVFGSFQTPTQFAIGNQAVTYTGYKVAARSGPGTYYFLSHNGYWYIIFTGFDGGDSTVRAWYGDFLNGFSFLS